MTSISTDLALSSAMACLTAHPELHARNRFAHDVVDKYRRYGSLSATQVAALQKSLNDDHEREWVEAATPKGEAPEGRVTVTGEVLVVKEKASLYGVALKMMVKLPNNSKVWVTVPAGASPTKGDSITFTATFSRSKDDPSFAFGSRPVLEPTVHTTAPVGIPLSVHPDPFNPPKLAAEMPQPKALKREAQSSILSDLLNELLNEREELAS